MKHFVQDDGFNVFRLPVGWQFLTNDVLGGAIDEDNFEQYDTLVQACINAGAAACIVDIHNYARWDKGVRKIFLASLVGQEGFLTLILLALDHRTRRSY